MIIKTLRQCHGDNCRDDELPQELNYVGGLRHILNNCLEAESKSLAYTGRKK